MFVVAVGCVFTTASFFSRVVTGADAGFSGQISLWLWFTVLFANFAEALAEGRGKAQADTLRSARTDTVAHRLLSDGTVETVSASELAPGDRVVVEAGDMIPADGTVVEGVAAVDESAITGESAPVIRESGGDRSAVTGGTTVLSDRIVVNVTQEPGKSFLDRACRRRGTAEDPQRNRLEHPACRADPHLHAGGRHPEAAGPLPRHQH